MDQRESNIRFANARLEATLSIIVEDYDLTDLEVKEMLRKIADRWLKHHIAPKVKQESVISSEAK